MIHQEESFFVKVALRKTSQKSVSCTTGGKKAKELLRLVHSDVCGRVQTPSLGSGHYFLTFIDDKLDMCGFTF